MKSLAELKRTVKVGSQIAVVSHWRDAVRADQPPMAGTVRIVTKAQGNGYFYVQEKNGKRLWGDYPDKAKDITFNDDGSFTIRFGDKGSATFSLTP